MSEFTIRERVALVILSVMFEIIAPNKEYKHLNKAMMDKIFAAIKGQDDE